LKQNKLAESAGRTFLSGRKNSGKNACTPGKIVGLLCGGQGKGLGMGNCRLEIQDGQNHQATLWRGMLVFHLTPLNSGFS
jgi:hypothetical protein